MTASTPPPSQQSRKDELAAPAAESRETFPEATATPHPDTVPLDYASPPPPPRPERSAITLGGVWGIFIGVVISIFTLLRVGTFPWLGLIIVVVGLLALVAGYLIEVRRGVR